MNSEQNLMHAGNLSKVFYLNLFPLFEDSDKNNNVEYGNDIKNSINKEILEDLIKKGDLLMDEMDSEDFQKKIYMDENDIENFVFPEDKKIRQCNSSCAVC